MTMLIIMFTIVRCFWASVGWFVVESQWYFDLLRAGVGRGPTWSSLLPGASLPGLELPRAVCRPGSVSFPFGGGRPCVGSEALFQLRSFLASPQALLTFRVLVVLWFLLASYIALGLARWFVKTLLGVAMPAVDRCAWWLLRNWPDYGYSPRSLHLGDMYLQLRGDVCKNATQYCDRIDELENSFGGPISPMAALPLARLRRRARWVRVAEAVVGAGRVGTWIRGRWTPDLPTDANPDVCRWLMASLPTGAKVLGGGLEQVTTTDWRDGFYLVVAFPDGRRLVFPELLGRLRQYSLFRDRDVLLLGGLRARAVEWCRARGLRSWVAEVAVSSAVALAFEPSTHEEVDHLLVKERQTPTPALP